MCVNKINRKGRRTQTVCFMCMHLNIHAFRRIHSRKSKLRRKYKGQIYKEKNHTFGEMNMFIPVKH